MRSYVDRFNYLYSHINDNPKMPNLSKNYDLGRFGMKLRVETSTNIDPDLTQQIASRSIRLLLSTIGFHHKKDHSCRLIDSVALNCSSIGEVTFAYTENMTTISPLRPEHNYHYPEWTHEVLEPSKGIALESAFVAIESVLGVHDNDDYSSAPLYPPAAA